MKYTHRFVFDTNEGVFERYIHWITVSCLYPVGTSSTVFSCSCKELLEFLLNLWCFNISLSAACCWSDYCCLQSWSSFSLKLKLSKGQGQLFSLFCCVPAFPLPLHYSPSKKKNSSCLCSGFTVFWMSCCFARILQVLCVPPPRIAAFFIPATRNLTEVCLDS